MTTQPSAQQIAFAILASLPQQISYSGSDEWRILATTSLTPVDGDGGAPFATAITIQGAQTSFTMVIAATEDLSPLDDMRWERSVAFEVKRPE
jgi:hypothetical protein